MHVDQVDLRCADPKVLTQLRSKDVYLLELSSLGWSQHAAHEAPVTDLHLAELRSCVTDELLQEFSVMVSGPEGARSCLWAQAANATPRPELLVVSRSRASVEGGC